MKNFFSNITPPVLYILSVIALVVYLLGFFPFHSSLQTSELRPVKSNNNFPFQKKLLFHKLVLMVIDALRFDFVQPINSERYMYFTTSSILSNQSCLIKLRAQAPTVTMPRVKAMTSGVIPTYFDVVSNFMSAELKLDSFIKQGAQKNLKIVFYGDDTWIKLFPNEFIRSEGTNSFFASDYTEVDDNVTRHLDKEFKRNDWDFLILHYLGLDHIGHMEGPRSPLVRPKLKEMDSIILEIYKHVKKMEEVGINSLFIVTSDHGMKDSGGHGGVTYPEIMVPLVSIGKACNHIPGWPTDYIAEQIDLAPTISAAFGLPIPGNNIGKVIPSLFSGADMKTILDILEINVNVLKCQASQMKEVNCYQSNNTNGRHFFENSDIKKRTVKYFSELSYFSDNLRKISEFNVPYLILSILSMWIILIILLLGIYKKAQPKRLTQYFLLLGTFLYSISFASTSLIEEEHQTWYFLWTTVCMLCIFETLNRSKLNLQVIKTVLPWIGVIISHRYLRKLNQTGDKWAMLPDIKSFLIENPFLLAVIYLAGLCGLFYCALTDGCSVYELITFSCGLLLNLSYRLSVSSLDLHFLSCYPKSRGKWECIIFWILTAIFAVQTASKRKPGYLIWALIASILLKPHNVILLPMEIITSRQIRRFYEKTDEIWITIAHFWMGYVFYFYQGNGNSIANVDVSPGFIGLEEHNALYSFIMIAAHTNSGHILSFLLCPRHILTISSLRLIPLTFYCTFLAFQLNHLFIWSVFSPKLLYETNFHVIFLILMCCSWFYSLADYKTDRINKKIT